MYAAKTRAELVKLIEDAVFETGELSICVGEELESMPLVRHFRHVLPFSDCWKTSTATNCSGTGIRRPDFEHTISDLANHAC